MGIYDANYYKQAAEALPPNKRLPIYLKWVYTLVSPMNWLRNVVFNVFKAGETYAEYAAGTYALGDRVKYGKGYYESLTDSNTDAPTQATWLLIADNFIGVDDRILFRSEKILFEYALNTWFNTDANPCTWSNAAGASTIYITNNSIATGFFRVGTNQDLSSNVGFGEVSEPIGNDGGSLTIQYAFTINIPTAVYTALGADASIREQTVRNFADKYNTVGLFYNIQTY
jgi:hypothetical protein